MKRTYEKEALLTGPLPDEVILLTFSFSCNTERLRMTVLSKTFFAFLTPLIKEVTFHSNRWNPEKVKERLPSLTSLSLLNCSGHLTDSTLIGSLTALKSLSLVSSCRTRGGDIMRSLSKLTNLKHLYLRYIPVESETIFGLTNLKSLGLMETNIGDKGLSCLTNLTLLNLSKNVQYGITSQSLGQLTKLESLITGNNFSNSVLKKLTNLRKLVLHENSRVKWKTIWSLPKLKKFVIYNCDKMDYRYDEKGWEVRKDWAYHGKKLV